MSCKKIAFVGPKEYAGVMRFAGFECYSVFNKTEAGKKIKELEEADYALIFVSQDICPDKTGMDRVVVLPGMLEGKDDNFLQEEISKAIGGDIEL